MLQTTIWYLKQKMCSLRVVYWTLHLNGQISYAFNKLTNIHWSAAVLDKKTIYLYISCATNVIQSANLLPLHSNPSFLCLPSSVLQQQGDILHWSCSGITSFTVLSCREIVDQDVSLCQIYHALVQSRTPMLRKKARRRAWKWIWRAT